MRRDATPSNNRMKATVIVTETRWDCLVKKTNTQKATTKSTVRIAYKYRLIINKGN